MAMTDRPTGRWGTGGGPMEFRQTDLDMIKTGENSWNGSEGQKKNSSNQSPITVSWLRIELPVDEIVEVDRLRNGIPCDA